MGNTLYLELHSGISGDMTAAALIDLGGDQEALDQALRSLPVSGFRTVISRVKKAAIDCCDFNVTLDAEHENHDHDMDYLFGDFGGEGHEHGHSHEDHSFGHAHHHHEHRSFADIKEILAKAKMTEGARELALKIFTILAKAEAKAHDTAVDQVHFHEVGAVDSIVDIVAAAVLFDSLDIDRVIIPSVTEGTGNIRSQHGILPVPVPAVLNIAEEEGLPLHIDVSRKGELVTPTGAAFAAAVQTEDKLPENFRILKIGIGAGKRKYNIPSMVRAMLIEPIEEPVRATSAVQAGEDLENHEDRIMKLETNIDDSTGEQLGYVMEELMAAGARDVHYVPCYMKKNRPAWQLNVICTVDQAEKMEEIIFRDTTTIGIRRLKLERSCLKREMAQVMTKCGPARIKVVRLGERKKCYPEYEDIARIAGENGLAFDEAKQLVLEQAKFL